MNDLEIFKTNFDDLMFEDSNGNMIEENKKDYFNRIEKESITYNKELEIGDQVKLKGVDYNVIVKHKNFEVPNLGIVDYAGTRDDDITGNLVLFNQKDIEKVNKETKINIRQ